MASVIVKMKIMPSSADIDLTELRHQIMEEIDSVGAHMGAMVSVPVAFGLKALELTYSVDESSGDTEVLEEKLKEIDGIQSVSVESVSRALG